MITPSLRRRYFTEPALLCRSFGLSSAIVELLNSNVTTEHPHTYATECLDSSLTTSWVLTEKSICHSVHTAHPQNHLCALFSVDTHEHNDSAHEAAEITNLIRPFLRADGPGRLQKRPLEIPYLKTNRMSIKLLSKYLGM